MVAGVIQVIYGHLHGVLHVILWRQIRIIYCVFSTGFLHLGMAWAFHKQHIKKQPTSKMTTTYCITDSFATISINPNILLDIVCDSNIVLCFMLASLSPCLYCRLSGSLIKCMCRIDKYACCSLMKEI